MKVVLRPEAHSELLEAQAWYEERSPGLGLEFARAIDAAISQAARMPLAFPPIEEGFRHVICRRFPYSVIYCLEGPTLLVVACFHHRRRPGSWKARLKGT